MITASIWRNSTEKGDYFSTTFERRYQDRDGNWKSTTAYAVDDLLALAKAAELAYVRSLELRAGGDTAVDAASDEGDDAGE